MDDYMCVKKNRKIDAQKKFRIWLKKIMRNIK